MPEGVGYGPQNTASVGKELNVIGKHAYANSGMITSAGAGSADTTYLEFTTGSYYTVAILNIYEKSSGNHERFADVLFNAVEILQLKGDTGPDWLEFFPIRLLIPPYTGVTVKVGTNGGSPFSAVLRGRIYE